jgi:hypothetical protein
VNNLSSTLGVLSAMITPAVLIMACGSLILTTSTRLIRAIDRVREIMVIVESEGPADARQQMLLDQVGRSTRRARILQHALSQLYAAIGMFVATSISIGLVSLVHVPLGWIPLTLGLFGACLLFSASMMLIYESRIAIRATYAEMDYITSIASSRRPS